MGIHAHSPVAGWREFGEFRQQLTLRVEEIFRPVTPHPGIKDCQMFWILPNIIDRHLVSAPRALHRLSVHLLRTCPAFRCPQNEQRPAWTRGISFVPGAM